MPPTAKACSGLYSSLAYTQGISSQEASQSLGDTRLCSEMPMLDDTKLRHYCASEVDETLQSSELQVLKTLIHSIKLLCIILVWECSNSQSRWLRDDGLEML